MSLLKKSFIKGVLWSFTGHMGYLSVTLITNIVLARLLSPFEFGQIGIIMFFIVLANVMTESGLAGALVRKKDASEEDFSTVFVFNLVVSVFLFVTLFLSSGFIADFYNNRDLQKFIPPLSFILVINAFRFSQNAKLIKELKFKKQSLYTLISITLSSVCGVILAFLDYGVWALVIMQIGNSLILTLLFWIFEKPLSSFNFNMNSFKSLYKFGLYTTLASLLNSIFDNIYNLILGKYFSIQHTGLYYQAKKIQDIPIGIINSATQGVFFSTLSTLQDDRSEFYKFYRKITTIFTVVTGLICLLIYFYAEQTLLLLFGKQWVGAVFYLKILIFSSFFFMQEMMNRVLFKVFDRTDKILYLEIIKKTIQGVTIIIGVIYLSIEILLYGFLLTSFISYFINYYHSRKIYNKFSWGEVLTIIKVFSISSFVLVIGNIGTNLLNLKTYESFILLPFMVCFYFFMMKIFRIINIANEMKLIINYRRIK